MGSGNRKGLASTKRRTHKDTETEKDMEAEPDPKVGEEIAELETKTRGLEGQGQSGRQEVSSRAVHDQDEDPDRGRDQRQVLHELPGGDGEHRGREIGGRKCCPELPRDCYFTEKEFAAAHRDRHEMCVIDVEQSNCFRTDDEDDADSFHDVPEEGEGIEVYECNEYTLVDRATFAYDSGDFSFSTCQELLDDAFDTVLKGRVHRGNVIDGAKNSLVLGYYCHAGMNGVTKGVVNHTALTRHLNHFVAAHNPPGATWSALSIFKGGVVKVHHDYNNAAGSRNYFASFGQISGGELWVHDNSISEQTVAQDEGGAIQWKRTRSGEWLPGRLFDSQENFVEFDPHVKHQVVEVKGEAWQIVAYSPRGTDTIDGDVKKFLKNCGFPLGSKRKQGQGKTTSRPSKKQRNAITNTVGKLSVLFTTLLAAAGSFLQETVKNDVVYDPVVMLEIGGFDATLEATELNKSVIEPLSWEDYLDHGTKDRTLHLVKAITPRELHIHLTAAPNEAYDDLKLLVKEQLEGGGAVVLQGGRPQQVIENSEFYLRYHNNHEGEDWTVLARPGSKNLEPLG